MLIPGVGLQHKIMILNWKHIFRYVSCIQARTEGIAYCIQCRDLLGRLKLISF